MNEGDINLSLQMKGLAQQLDVAITAIAGERRAFALLVGSELGMTQYISNGDRSDMIRLMKELLQRWEEDSNDIPAHLRN